MKARAWLERGAIVLAALATIATSRKGWVVEATQPPDDPAKARLLVVEASHAPEIEMVVDGNYERARPLDANATWPGTARYLIPTGAILQRVLISEKCNGSMCKKCEPPSGARVAITSITPVQTWKLATTREPDPQPSSLRPEKITSFRIDVDSTHPVRLSVTSSGPAAHVSNHGGEHRVSFGYVEQPVSLTWSVTATIEEPCSDAAQPCAPPPGARVEIRSITRESHDAP